jgi:lipopolysaccharide transport system ATP-binding protein
MLGMQPAISIQNLSKVYKIYHNPYGRILESLPWVKTKKHRQVPALQDITAEVSPGQCVGLIGGNGAGKSTLLKVLTGTTEPTSGRFTVRGRVASLLELGAGFHKDFSGRENIFMNAALMGFSRAETKRKYHDILEFSELEAFINEPVRTYSSGMVCRLGFSVAVATDPDVLIIDEILAVGDMHFQRKCTDKIMSFKDAGKTLFFCSHSLYDVRQICDNAIWLQEGRVRMFDDAVAVTNDYAVYENQLIEQQKDSAAAIETDLPTGPASSELLPHILSAELFDPASGEARSKFAPHEAVGVRIRFRNGENPVPLSCGVLFSRPDGIICFAPVTGQSGVEIPAEMTEGEIRLILPEVRLLSGRFTVPVFLLDHRGVHRYHQMMCREDLVVQNRTKDLGVFRVDYQWEIDGS